MDRKILRWNFIFQYGYVITNIINSIILLPFYLKKIDPSTFLHLITSRYSMGVLTGFSAGIAFMLTVGKLKKWIKEIKRKKTPPSKIQ